MPEVIAQVNPFMTYEHKDKDGKTVSIGKNRLLRHQRLEFTQETGTGQKMYQSIEYIPKGQLLEEKFYTDGKETEKLNYAYTDKGELLSVTDKQGVISLNPEIAEGEILK
jgi:hypothetical protein